jgi:hypothetical protein
MDGSATDFTLDVLEKRPQTAKRQANHKFMLRECSTPGQRRHQRRRADLSPES